MVFESECPVFAGGPLFHTFGDVLANSCANAFSASSAFASSVAFFALFTAIFLIIINFLKRYLDFFSAADAASSASFACLASNSAFSLASMLFCWQHLDLFGSV